MRKLLLSLFIMLFVGLGFAQESQSEMFLKGHKKEWSESQNEAYKVWESTFFNKASAGALRQRAIMNGNKITTEIWNFGSISSPGNTITDIIWEGLGYGYEFAPFVASEVIVPKGSHPDVKVKLDKFDRPVIDKNGDTVYVAHVISDGLKSNGGELSGNGTTRWGWQPMVQSDDAKNVFLNLDSDFLPTSDDRDLDNDGKPDSWPKEWYNENLRRYVWPGALGQGATNSDKEAFFVMDDRDNLEFEYYPFPNDSSRKGLGLEVEARYYQWSNAEAEDALFMIYKITNKGYYDLNEVIFGMWGDPHIGGPADWRDDVASFDKELEMTFAWDNDLKSLNNPDITPGYLGYKFLESPGVSDDGIDNDNDGIVDESWTNGIDDDGDWNPETDDTGVDGVPNSGDEGENDGIPTAGDPFDISKPGEPNFEFTDIDESDMLGLTSFQHPAFSAVRINNDERMWNDYIQPGQFDTTKVSGDNVFLYGSGRFTLKSIYNVTASEVSDAIKRFSIALIVAQDRKDLTINAKAVQRIYNSGYQFAKPPAKPTLTLVPGDGKVTLFWNDVAENSIDPISKENDFEGYVIYRSTDVKFLDQQTITDASGIRFLYTPLKNQFGIEAKFDLKNDIVGPASVPYNQRGISYYMGDDTGIRHSYVDSNNVINGQTYFYAIVAYDRGSDSLRIAPSECSKIITYNPLTDKYSFDINTGSVIPRVKAAGYQQAEIKNGDDNNGFVREEGFSTGTFNLKILDERSVENDNKFVIEFTDTASTKEYSVLDDKEKTGTFTSFYNEFVTLKHANILASSVTVKSTDGATTFTEGVDYEFEPESGSIKVFDPALNAGASMVDETVYSVTYKNYPIFRSTNIDSQLSNPVFDGLKLVVKESEFAINKKQTGWSASSRSDLESQIINKKEDLFDYEVAFSASATETAVNGVTANFTIKDVINDEIMKFAVIENPTTSNGTWDLGEAIWILRGGSSPANSVWEIKINSKTQDMTPLTANDKFFLATDKPFSNGDKFSFTTKAAQIDKRAAKNQLDKISVVPNPYVATNIIEPLNNVNRVERGDRRIYFNHLPNVCTIRIYTQAGELVRKLEHNSSIDDGKKFWDLRTRDNMEVAYGLYFFHVDAPGIGEKVGKFAIIK